MNHVQLQPGASPRARQTRDFKGEAEADASAPRPLGYEQVGDLEDACAFPAQVDGLEHGEAHIFASALGDEGFEFRGRPKAVPAQGLGACGDTLGHALELGQHPDHLHHRFAVFDLGGADRHRGHEDRIGHSRGGR